MYVLTIRHNRSYFCCINRQENSKSETCVRNIKIQKTNTHEHSLRLFPHLSVFLNLLCITAVHFRVSFSKQFQFDITGHTVTILNSNSIRVNRESPVTSVYSGSHRFGCVWRSNTQTMWQ